ncbi:MAG: class SAM-dependent methyltransferase [Devosia sp.]|nr:class SAM-dependent methyltransferase [Devosia sp.]
METQSISTTARFTLWNRLTGHVMDWVGRGLLGKPRIGGITMTFPNGRSITVGDPSTGEHASLTIRNRRMIKRVIQRGVLGFAEAYIDGDVEVDDLAALFRFFLQNREIFADVRPGLFRKAAQDLQYHLSRSNTKEQAPENISEHYDLGNDFYAEWLDPSMTYSSAIFTGEDEGLEAAQLGKYRRIADLAGIEEGSSVLEIGCGWAGFAEVAARDYQADVYGVTLSKEQLEFGRQRLRRQGLDNRATLHFEDYRDTEGQFDAIVSIEMIEAVGEEHWDEYFRTVHARLKPGGRAAIQAITIAESDFAEYRDGPDFIQRYIFPGGMLLTKSVMRETAEKFGLILENVDTFRHSYAKTLKLWRERFLERWPVIAPMGYDQSFMRKWSYYLAYCEAGFTEGTIDVGIYQYRKPV